MKILFTFSSSPHCPSFEGLINESKIQKDEEFITIELEWETISPYSDKDELEDTYWYMYTDNQDVLYIGKSDF